jgi:hypothetical protein
MAKLHKHKTSFGIKHYYKPTPVFWRKLGDSLLAGATIITVGGLWDFNTLSQYFTPSQVRFLIGTSVVLGILGKMLSNFFGEETKSK